jgi:hypothetical protein
MKIYITLSIVLISALFAFGQNEAELEQYFKRKHAIESKSMVALGTWSVSNLAIGTYQAIALPEGPDKYFHRMNAFWNVVNLPIAIWGFTKNARHKGMPDVETMRKQQKNLEIALLVNSGFDLTYIGAGIWMNQRANSTNNPSMVRGFGNSLMLQGSYLLVTDLVQYTIHRINRKRHFSSYKTSKIITDF